MTAAELTESASVGSTDDVSTCSKRGSRSGERGRLNEDTRSVVRPSTAVGICLNSRVRGGRSDAGQEVVDTVLVVGALEHGIVYACVEGRCASGNCGVRAGSRIDVDRGVVGEGSVTVAITLECCFSEGCCDRCCYDYK